MKLRGLHATWAALGLASSALLSFGWSALMAWQIVDHLWYGRQVDPLDFSIAMAIVVATGAFGTLLLRSPAAARVRP